MSTSLEAVAWDLDPLVDGDGEAGADRLLAEAQELGYAEPDPTNDVEAHDATYKLAILASLAFGAPVTPDQIYREGITQLSSRDFEYAADLGYTVKLLAIAEPRAAEFKPVVVFAPA